MGWSLEGRTALVTGASSGIGEAMVRRLVAAGSRVVATARREDRLSRLAGELGPDRVLVVAADVTTAEGRGRIADVARTLEPVTLLVNNAGYGQRGPVELVPLAEARRQFDVNVFAPIELTRLLLPAMRARGEGRILNVSSVVGKVSFAMSGWYSATKFALEALSDAMRQELAPFGIEVVLIEPGPIRTEFFDVAESTMDQLEGDREAYDPIVRGVGEGRQRTRESWLTADGCAAVMMRAATACCPRARYPVTTVARILIALHGLLPTRIFDRLLARATGLPGFGALRRRAGG